MTYEVFIEWLPCRACGASTQGLIRLFEQPVEKLAEDGMPDQPWVWGCHITKVGELVTFRGALTAPPTGSHRTIVRALREVGGHRTHWERCTPGKAKLRQVPRTLL